MSRRSFLGVVLSGIIVTGVFLVGHIFTSSLKPNTKSEYSKLFVFDVSNIKAGEEKEFDSYHGPILIRRVSANELVVFLMVPKFKDKSVHGCAIKAVKEEDLQYYPANTVYAEQCRSVSYDHEGNILPGSHGGALPIEKLTWEYASGDKTLIKLST